MARRKGFLRRIIDAFRGDQAPKRRATTRETRRFRRGKEVSSRVAEQYAQDRRDAHEQQLARRRQRAQEQRDRRRSAERPYRDMWGSQSGLRRVDFAAHYRIFNQLPLGDDITDEERERLWQSYVQNMVGGRGFQKNDVLQNPFWSEVGIDPSRFRWDEWRRAMAKAGTP